MAAFSKKDHILMRKLTKEQKINIYKKRKAGATINALANEYSLRKESIKYLLRLIDQHGYDILHEGYCRRYSKEEKEKAILEVLEQNKSIGETAIKYGLSSKTALTNWIKSYIQNDYHVVEKKRGRPAHTFHKASN